MKWFTLGDQNTNGTPTLFYLLRTVFEIRTLQGTGLIIPTSDAKRQRKRKASPGLFGKEPRIWRRKTGEGTEFREASNPADWPRRQRGRFVLQDPTQLRPVLVCNS